MAPFRSLALLFLIVPLATSAELTTLDNKKATGIITGFTADGVLFKAGTTDETYEYTKIDSITVGANPVDPLPGTKWIEVELIDGTQFRCSDFRIKNKTVVLTLLAKSGRGQLLEIPAKQVLYMIRDLSDPKLNQAFRNLLSKRGKLDLWIVPKPETLDAVPGTFGDGDEKGEITTFQTDNGLKNPIQFTALYGAIFSPPTDIEVGQTICRITDANKNVLNAKSIKLTDRKTVEIETTTGVKIEYPAIAAIAKFDFAAGALRFLSALNPSKVDITEPLGFPPEVYRRDRSLNGQEIKINGKPYARGLAMHSKTVLTYDLGGQYKRFQAVVGIDDCVEGENVVTLTVTSELNVKPLLKQIFKKGDDPKLLNLNILNVKQLTITVESDFLVGGQLDLADAKVLK